MFFGKPFFPQKIFLLGFLKLNGVIRVRHQCQNTTLKMQNERVRKGILSCDVFQKADAKGGGMVLGPQDPPSTSLGRHV